MLDIIWLRNSYQQKKSPGSRGFQWIYWRDVIGLPSAGYFPMQKVTISVYQIVTITRYKWGTNIDKKSKVKSLYFSMFYDM